MEAIERYCERKGLIFLGGCDLEIREDYRRFQRWLERGAHAGMHYLLNYPEVRKFPDKLLLGAKSALVVGMPYYQGDSVGRQPLPASPKIAQYARIADYHKVLKRLTRELIIQLRSEWGGEYRALVDTAPLLERALARKSGAGFIGKNTCFIHPSQGSFLFLAEILSTLPFGGERVPMQSGCGSCTSCQTICPTGALDKDYVLDANKCLAYWTIEHRGPIPEEFWPYLAHYVFGCDLCQLVCPFNQGITPVKVVPRVFPSLFEVAVMDQKSYGHYFGGTPMTRATRNGLRRNALIAMTVTRDPKLQEAMDLCLAVPEFPISETLDQIRGWLRSC